MASASLIFPDEVPFAGFPVAEATILHEVAGIAGCDGQGFQGTVGKRVERNLRHARGNRDMFQVVTSCEFIIADTFHAFRDRHVRQTAGDRDNGDAVGQAVGQQQPGFLKERFVARSVSERPRRLAGQRK